MNTIRDTDKQTTTNNPTNNHLGYNMTSLQRLNLGLERAERVRLQAQQSESLTSEVRELAAKLEQGLKPILLKAKEVNINPDLTPAGKTKKMAELTNQAIAVVAAHDPAAQLRSDIELAEAKIINKVAVIQQRNLMADPMTKLLDQMRQQEARSLLIQYREQAKALHDERMKAHPGPLSDEERAFQDPIKVRYLDATANEGGQHDVIRRAIETSPVPMVDMETLNEGAALYRGRIAKDELAEQHRLITKAEMARELFLQAMDLASNPARNQPIEGPYIPHADNGGEQ